MAWSAWALYLEMMIEWAGDHELLLGALQRVQMVKTSPTVVALAKLLTGNAE